MPSHLTRNVFRQILANEPIIYRGCLRRPARRSLCHRSRPIRPSFTHYSLPLAPSQQKRTMFNFNIFTKKDEVREADIDPGIEKMMELAKRERMKARMPPPEDVVKALTRFFDRSKRDKGAGPIAVTDTHAQLAGQSLKYLIRVQRQQQLDQQEQVSNEENVDGVEDQRADVVPFPALRTAAGVLRRNPEPTSAAHVELAKLIYEVADSATFARDAIAAFVFTLSRTGQAMEARTVLLKYEESLRGAAGHSAMRHARMEQVDEEADLAEAERDEIPTRTTHYPAVWRYVLDGFAKEDNATEVDRTFKMIQERGMMQHRGIITVMLDYALYRGNVARVKEWWNAYHQQNINAPMEEYEDFVGPQLTKVLKWCLEQNELDAGHAIVRELMTSSPPKPLWDSILIWAAGTKRSVDEIDRMMTVMETSNSTIADESQWRLPDIATINGLIEFAISQNDPYMAERFITLGRDRNIEPDAKTLVLQMDYRLSVGDVDGALIAYKNLQAKEKSDDDDLPTINRLIVALCQTQRHDFDTIMNVAADLSDRGMRFHPSTTSALSILHLSRDEHDDVLDLLNTHAFHYSSAERSLIRSAIVTFAIDPKTHLSRAWGAYMALKTVFDELAREDRTVLMSSFLTPTRARTDMAVHIFQNMRMHNRPDTLPTADTYVTIFLGAGQHRDLPALETVHNLLKLDPTINSSTRLRNALILAYTACGEPRRGLDFWDEVVASREGPSYNSIHAALRACENSPFGDEKAQAIWALLRKRNVELDQELWASYLAALCGNGKVELALSTLEEALKADEVAVDEFLLGSLMAGSRGERRQGVVEAWAKERFAAVWEALEAGGWETDEEETKSFLSVDRSVAP